MKTWPLLASLVALSVSGGVLHAQTQPQTDPPQAAVAPSMLDQPQQASRQDGDPDGDWDQGWDGGEHRMPMQGHGQGFGHGRHPMWMGGGRMGRCGKDGGHLGPASAAPTITTDSVGQSITRYLARRGNPRLVLGAVSKSADGIITAEIVTAKEKALVDRFAVDPRTGRWQRIE